jgi:molybdopterin-guanine dinucleotide biosynthesis protein A
MTIDVNAIVLAGGKNLRMGSNKALKKIGEVTLIERVISRLRPIARKIIVVTADGPHELPPLGDALIVPDVYPGKGPLAGIYAGLVTSDSDLNIIVACDMPFLSRGLLQHLASIAPGHDAVIPRLKNGMIEALHGVYSQSCLPVMKTHLDSERLRIQPALEDLNVLYVGEDECRRFDPDLWSFFNINRPSDLDLALKMAEDDLGHAGDMRGDAVRLE